MKPLQILWFFIVMGSLAMALVCNPPDATEDPGENLCSELGLMDRDGDGVPDWEEGNGEIDTDHDGTPDINDTDSDGDGRPDADESGLTDCTGSPRDSDSDGIPDLRDTDSDDNGILDRVESDEDRDSDEIPDWRDLDDDGDGISDLIEIGPDPLDPADSDGNGIPDYHSLDSDGDFIPDALEGTADPDLDGRGNYVDDDSDGDGLSDLDEGNMEHGGAPRNSDGDGTPDYLDLDSDDDLLRDFEEIEHETDPCNPDTDGDLYTDYREIVCLTDPTDGTDYPIRGRCAEEGCGPVELCGEGGTGNGTDEDCDGQVDEGCPCPALGATQPCWSGSPLQRNQGICTDGVQVCSEFLGWGECEGGNRPEPEICGDGIDQDCSGEDEDCCIPFPDDCFCVPGAVRFCDDPVYCAWATQTCNDEGTGWGLCAEAPGPPECDSYIYSTDCCVLNGYCCQDFHDIDGDGDRDESLGVCEDIMCERCECDMGDARYCGRGSSWSGYSWGIQLCEENSFGRVWGACEFASPPELCAGFPNYDAGGQGCCADNGFCCRDSNDVDHDLDTNESVGHCVEPLCCMNL